MTIHTKSSTKTSGPKSSDSTEMTQMSASLEGLPVELKRSILHSAPTISTMQTLVLSSPLYHKIYAEDRKAILSAILLRDIGSDIVRDALAVFNASQIGFDGTNGRRQDVESFLSRYKAERERSPDDIWDSLDIGTLVALSRLHSVVSQMASDFCEVTLSLSPVTGERMQSHGRLARNEKRRIYRAFYRFELFRVLFTAPRQVPDESRNCFDAMDQSFCFLLIFKIWEVEELACVRDYIIRRYEQILQESSSELAKLRPNKDLIGGYWKSQNTGYFMSLGLSFLNKLVNLSTVSEKTNLIQHELNCDRYFLTDALKEDPYHFVYQTDLYIAAEEGQDLLFEDDGLIDGPNAAWPWSTNGKVYIFYFEEHKEHLRRWAYVMWDHSRLEDWRILDADPEHVCNV